jgi:tetratricopeptide (TPR) repeat protein/transcriptional regulator with XRE-family HTH domain
MPNIRLKSLLVQSGWKQIQLAAAVRVVAAEHGGTLFCDRSTVSRWLAGTQPRPPAPAYLLEVFSRRLARTVTADEAGLTRAPATLPDMSWQADPLRKLWHLIQGELGRGRESLASPRAYGPAVLAVPAWTEFAALSFGRPARRLSAEPREVGRTKADTVQSMAVFFADAIATQGGAHMRTALAAYLVDDVTAALHSPAAEAVHQQLLSGAAQLAILLGNMCADDADASLAKHYHRTAAHLSADARDGSTYSIALRAMATHADELGHHRDALVLARQAADTARQHAPRITRAYTQAQLALAEARNQNRHPALAALENAEHLRDGAGSEPGPFTCYSSAALYYQRGRVLTALGDHTGAFDALTASLRKRDAGQRRARALTSARLAEALLRQGHLEGAVPHWQTFLDEYPALNSDYAIRRLTAMRQLLRPHDSHHSAALLLDRATGLI